jgi:hypothetical protein
MSTNKPKTPMRFRNKKSASIYVFHSSQEKWITLRLINSLYTKIKLDDIKDSVHAVP